MAASAAKAFQWLLSKISFWRPKPSAPTLTAATQVTRQSAPPPPKAPQSSPRANPARGTTEMGVSPQPPSPKTAMAFNPLQAIKPHLAMIKFPNRLGADGKPMKLKFSPSMSMPGALSQQLGLASSSIPVVPSPAPSQSKPIGYTPRGSGIDSREIPARYRRKPLAQEEMDAIERGGM